MQPLAHLTAAALLLVFTADRLDAQPRWTITPELRIGSVDDEEQALTRIGAVLIGNDGRIYIGQSQDQQIRVYSPEGRLLRTIGRKGAGPGEFEGMSSVHWHGDTLVVSDFRHRRLSLFTRDGEFLHTLTIMPRQEAPWLGASAHRLLPDGTALASPSVPSSSIADGSVTHMPLWRVDREGRILRTVFMRDARTGQLAISIGNGQLYSSQPYSDSPLTFEGDGGIVVVERRVAENAREGIFRVYWLGFDGDTLRSRSYRYTPQQVPGHIADSVLTARVKMYAEAMRSQVSQRELESALRRALVIPRFFAPITGVRVAANGEVWLNRGAGAPGHTRYNVLSPTGDVLAVFELPESVRIVLLHGDHLYAAETDELDVPYLVRYRVNRSAR